MRPTLKVPRYKTRLAFAGLKAGEYGSFDYGRNYGAIYDVESATDMLVEWGGDGWNYTDNHDRPYQRRNLP
jgi:outer membrane pore protein F